ncbi:MAG: RimK family protein [Bdellovibrionota bacterium]
MNTFIVTDNAKRLPKTISDVDIITTETFFTDPRFQSNSIRIINLCHSYSYQTSGYYVSLLASARGQKVLPDIETILDVGSKHFIKLRSEQLDDLIQKSFKGLQTDDFDLSLYFGKNTAKRYDKIAHELHKLFNVPLVRASFKRKDKWRLQKITPIGLMDVPESHIEILSEFAAEYFKKRQTNRRLKTARFDLAILVNEDEKQPPSNPKALKNFVKAANRLEVDVEFISKNDFHRIAEFDGLFIRETTEVNHHTFRFAHRAHSLGLTVIDDPTSILRCTNKVYLAELFQKNKISAPKTRLVYRDRFNNDIDDFEYPVVAKIPDSSFSRGVVKLADREELLSALSDMFMSTEVVLTQEFIPTKFDWRIGLIGGEPLYACKYFMARSHWQIYNHGSDGKIEDGEAETMSLNEVPEDVVNLAVKAGKLIGKGLYGIDIKQANGKLYVIEINDNPSIDAGCEDLFLGQTLYEKVMLYFRDQMEKIALGRAL